MTQSSDTFLSPVWKRLLPAPIVRGAGVHVFDTQGNRYIDFTSGIGVTGTGHCHPHVVQAIQEQASTLLFGQINCVVPDITLRYAEALSQVTPDGLDCFFFANSGAEAVEGAIKLARQATDRTNVIAFNGSFHGRTAMAMALTSSKTVYRAGYQPLPAGVHFTPFPYSYRYGWHETKTVEFCLRELDRLLIGQSAPDETAAMIIEPVLGEGGFVPAPLEFLAALREVCDAHGILLVFDEIQCGFGRSGTFWAHGPSGAVPDILLSAKAIASGVPLSAIIARRELMGHWPVGAHGSTYGGGSALAMAAGLATLEVIRNEDLVANARERGAQLRHTLLELQSRFSVMGDVRGVGLLLGVELMDGGTPATAVANAVQSECLDRGLMLIKCGTHNHVIRWLPPLIVSSDVIDEACSIFGAALESAVSSCTA